MMHDWEAYRRELPMTGRASKYRHQCVYRIDGARTAHWRIKGRKMARIHDVAVLVGSLRRIRSTAWWRTRSPRSHLMA
jgi:hypothetical protein